jgi:hypothetical protein
MPCLNSQRRALVVESYRAGEQQDENDEWCRIGERHIGGREASSYLL